MAAPADYKALHDLKAAPVDYDGDLVLAESQAIIDYIIRKYGDSRLSVDASSSADPKYLHRLNFANGTLQPNFSRMSILKRTGQADEGALVRAMYAKAGSGHCRCRIPVGKTLYLAGTSRALQTS